ncbi:TPA: hypothetical protein EYP70_04845, partial [Candidatus Bathyarchaeota archaeon]|nr:hypothetical protein [Candidatus Bathyarchaeota archaeon]
MVIRKEKAFKRIFFKFAGIQDDSRICDGLKVINGKQSLEVNETYVWIKSSGISNIKIGDVLQFNLTLRSMEESIPEF